MTRPSPATGRGAMVVGALLVVVIGAGVAAVWWTGSRMVMVVDSAGYLGAAENLEVGRGMTTPLALNTERSTPDQQVAWGDAVPLSEWPPGYPAALAVAGAAGSEPMGAARLVSVLGVGLLAGSVFGVLWFGTRSAVVAVAGAVVALIGNTVASRLGPGSPLGWSGVVASERLFLPLAMASLAACCWEPTRRSARRVQIAAVVVLAVAAVMVRYLGVAAAAAAAVAFLLQPDVSRRGRLARAAGVLGAALLAALLPGLVAGGAPKVVSWHDIALLEPFAETMGAWFMVPEGWPLTLRILLVSGLVGGPVAWTIARAIRSRRITGVVRVEVVLSTFVAVYLVAVVVTCRWLDAVVVPDQRILGPVQVAAGALLLVTLHDASGRLLAVRHPAGADADGVEDPGGRARRTAVGVAVVGVVIALVWVPATELSANHDYLTRIGRAQQDSLVDFPLRGIPEGTVVFADETSTIWLATGLPIYVVPSRVVVTTGRDNDAFDAQVDQMVRIVVERDGLVVLYGTGTSVRAEELVRRGLVQIADCDGTAVLARRGTSLTEHVVAETCRPAPPPS